MKQIIVADRGHVLVGEAELLGDNSIRLTEASVIRRWGTSNGLGQLAALGPQANTVLDKAGTVRIPSTSVVMTINVTFEGAWS